MLNKTKNLKILLLTLVIAFSYAIVPMSSNYGSGSINSPGDISLNESFNSSNYPSWPEGWRRFSLEINTVNFWSQTPAQPRTSPNCVRCIGHPNIRNNDWIITRMVYPTIGDTLFSFWYRAGQLGVYESLEVWVSTMLPDPDAMTTMLDAFSFNNEAYAQRVINLTDYINTPIYLGILYGPQNRQSVRIDDVVGPKYPPLDAATLKITSPATNFLVPGSFTPSALVKNYGSQAITNFPAACTVYSSNGVKVYSDLQIVNTLEPNTSTTVSFSTTPLLESGDYTMVIRTWLAGDKQPINDRIIRKLAVVGLGVEKFYDDGTVANAKWSGSGSGYGVRFTPTSYPATVCGAEVMLSHDAVPPQPAENIFRIRVMADTGLPGAVLWESDNIMGARGEWNVVPIPSITIDSGSYYIFWIQEENYTQCVGLGKDGADNAPAGTQWDYNGLNYAEKNIDDVGDRMIRAIEGFYTGSNIDAELFEILSPTGVIDTFAIQPKVRVRNNSTSSINIPVTFRIIKNSEVVYSNYQVALGVESGAIREVTFDNFYISSNDTGLYLGEGKTLVINDPNPGNDIKVCDFEIKGGGGGGNPSDAWVRMADIPYLPSGKGPKAGSCMAGMDGKIYYLKASNTQDFHIYTPNTGLGVWTSNIQDTMPTGTKGWGDGKRPKKGTAIAAYDAGKALYVLRGNNTLGFWRYQADTLDTLLPGWQKMTNIPLGKKRVKDGSGLLSITKAGVDYIFALKASKPGEFYLYNITSNSWNQVSSPPMGYSGKAAYRRGSCLAYDGNGFIYVLKGNYGDLFKYDIEADTWHQLMRYNHKIFLNRDGKKKKIKDGAAMVYYDEHLYFMKGGNTLEFWCYDIAKDTYFQMGPMQSWDIPIGNGKKVKAGGCMTVLGNEFYAAKGAKTLEFYQHYQPLATNSTNPVPPLAKGTMDQQQIYSDFSLSITPNPAINQAIVKYSLPKTGTFSLKLYNISGKLIKSYNNTNSGGMIQIDAKMLPAGVYLLKFDAGSLSTTRKLVLEK